MDCESFTKLLELLRASLSRSQGLFPMGPILAEIRLYSVLHWLAQRENDILDHFCIPRLSFEKIFWTTIDAIIEVPELQLKFPQTEEECLAAARGFQSICYNQAIDTCVCAIDGNHLEIDPPSGTETLHGCDFFSRRYGSFGMNIQGACDHQARFLFLGVGGPGDRDDDVALVECPLGDLIENLPGDFCAISDCGYLPSEHVIPLFGNEQNRILANRNFNYCASGCRVKIESAFGLMLQRWTIFRAPLPYKPTDVWKVVECGARLHNFCIDESSLKNRPPDKYFNHSDFAFRDEMAQVRFKLSLSDASLQKSRNRDRLVARIASKGLGPLDEYDEY